MKWIVIDGKGRKRLAKPNEIMPQPLIDNRELSLEDGDLVVSPCGGQVSNSQESESEVYRNGENERKSKNRKKHTKV
jgi:hypothetical protein